MRRVILGWCFLMQTTAMVCRSVIHLLASDVLRALSNNFTSIPSVHFVNLSCFSFFFFFLFFFYPRRSLFAVNFSKFFRFYKIKKTIFFLPFCPDWFYLFCFLKSPPLSLL